MAIVDPSKEFNPTNINVPYVGSGDFSVNVTNALSLLEDQTKQKAKNLKEMEENVNKYSSMVDDVLGIEIHNDYQKDVIDRNRKKYGIDDKFLNSITFDDLKNGVKISQAQMGAKKFKDDYEVKSVFKEQESAQKYLKEAQDIYAIDPALGLMAMNDYIEKYGNQKEKNYLGFPLNITKYKPMDVLGAIKELVDDIPKEYKLVKDPNSPDGYYFINKVSQERLSRKEVNEVNKQRLIQLRKNPQFDNNLKAIVGANGLDFDNEDIINKYVDDYMDNLDYEVVTDVMVKPVPKPPKAAAAKTSGGAKLTEKERRTQQFIKELKDKHPYIDLDNSDIYSSDLTDIANSSSRTITVNPKTGQLEIKYKMSTSPEAKAITKTINITDDAKLQKSKEWLDQLNQDFGSFSIDKMSVNSNSSNDVAGNDVSGANSQVVSGDTSNVQGASVDTDSGQTYSTPSDNSIPAAKDFSLLPKGTVLNDVRNTDNSQLGVNRPSNYKLTLNEIDWDVIRKNESSGKNTGVHPDGNSIGSYGLDFANSKKFLKSYYATSKIKDSDSWNDDWKNAWKEASKDPNFDYNQRQWMFKNLHSPVLSYAYDKANETELSKGVLNFIVDTAHQFKPDTVRQVIDTAFEKVDDISDQSKLLDALYEARVKKIPKYKSRYTNAYEAAKKIDSNMPDLKGAIKSSKDKSFKF